MEPGGEQSDGTCVEVQSSSEAGQLGGAVSADSAENIHRIT